MKWRQPDLEMLLEIVLMVVTNKKKTLSHMTMVELNGEIDDRMLFEMKLTHTLASIMTESARATQQSVRGFSNMQRLLPLFQRIPSTEIERKEQKKI